MSTGNKLCTLSFQLSAKEVLKLYIHFEKLIPCSLGKWNISLLLLFINNAFLIVKMFLYVPFYIHI